MSINVSTIFSYSAITGKGLQGARLPHVDTDPVLRAAMPTTSLFRIRLLHTFAWALFAVAIIAIPPVVLAGYHRIAIGLSHLVWVEIIVLAANGMRCPLTAVAARHTADRAANFDIFLPIWLARWNKHIFGSLFIAGQVFLWWKGL